MHRHGQRRRDPAQRGRAARLRTAHGHRRPATGGVRVHHAQVQQLVSPGVRRAARGARLTSALGRRFMGSGKLSRLAVLVCAGYVLGGVIALSVSGSGPAGAATGTGAATAPALGTVRLSASHGTVDRTPIFASATTSKPCPAGYGANALLRIGRPGGPFTNLAPPASGAFDRKPVTLRPNRSFATALGGLPAPGTWLVVVECYGFSLGRHPDRFATVLAVSAGAWRVDRRSGLPALAGPTGGTSSDQRLLLTIPPTATSTPSPNAGGGGGGGGSLAPTGAVIAAIVALGLALIAVGVTMLRARQLRIADAHIQSQTEAAGGPS